MKEYQNYERNMLYKKLNISNIGFKIKNLNKVKLNISPLSFNGKKIIDKIGKINNYSIKNLTFHAEKTKKPRFFNLFKTQKNYNPYNSLKTTRINNNKINKCISTKDIIEKKNPKEILFKKAKSFLFSHKKDLNKSPENSLPNLTLNNNSSSNGILNIKSYMNLSKSRHLPMATTKNKFRKSNYMANIIQLNNQIFKYYLFKRRWKTDKLLYDLKKSKNNELRKIDIDISFSKAKCGNSKIMKFLK